MTKVFMTDYLISIASNYWVSQFYRDFPEAANTFKSAGKFGIGFLSVFMLGSEVVVESNRLGEERYKLSLRGVGRRGELQKIRAPSGSGTSIKIKVKADVIEHLKRLDSPFTHLRTDVTV
jgi:HSP90 family molecular chaperone